MWIFYALGASFFAGITAILAKCGIKKTDSVVATALRTIVVWIFSWLMVVIAGTGAGYEAVSKKTLFFLILSGLSTGASWLCYFRALQTGDINKVVSIDKSSSVLTIILALIFLHEELTWTKVIAIILIAAGTMMMITNGLSDQKEKPGRWLIYAVLSAVFASLTTIFSKVGITGIDSHLGTAIRTTVVLMMAWLMVLITGRTKMVKGDKKELRWIILSGLTTGISWLCYYRALQSGPASAVISIDRLSILVTIGFSWLVFHEKLSKRMMAGVILMAGGAVLLAAV